MLTGDFAHYSPNYSDILVAICTLPLPRLREKAPWVPETVEQWFQRACAKEPLERFQSADEMTEALQAAAGDVAQSKHQSHPEFRIAPETLVGYATPAMATLQLDPRSAGLARTQVAVASGPSADKPPAAVVIAIGSGASDHEPGREPLDTQGTWTPPRRTLPPLALGIGLGLFVVLVTAITVALLTRHQTSESENRKSSSAPGATTASTEASLSQRAVPPRAADPTPSPLGPEAALPAGVSSVAAEAAETSAAPQKPRTKAASPKKAGSPAPATDAAHPPPPAPVKASGSDLGF
jgi:serine/threonine-protein kinase